MIQTNKNTVTGRFQTATLTNNDPTSGNYEANICYMDSSFTK